MYAIAADDDDSTIFAGTTLVNGGGWDFAASKLDVNGNELWKWQARAFNRIELCLLDREFRHQYIVDSY